MTTESERVPAPQPGPVRDTQSPAAGSDGAASPDAPATRSQPSRRPSYAAYIVESAWILPSIAVPVGMFVALVLTTYLGGLHLPGHADHLAVEAVTSTAPFNAPGTRQIRGNEWEVDLLAAIWNWNPREIRVPAGAKVTFVAASRDVTHSMMIEGTTVNMMILPGQVARATYTFERPGEYLLLCNEYCGSGHHLMAGKVIVEGTRAAGGGR